MWSGGSVSNNTDNAKGFFHLRLKAFFKLLDSNMKLVAKAPAAFFGFDNKYDCITSKM